MKEESLLLLSDLQKLINQVVLIDYTIKDPLFKQKIAQPHGLNDFSIRELV